MALERRLNDPALYPAPAPVNQPHVAQPGGRGGVDVVGDDIRNIARRERMQVQLALDRDATRSLSRVQPSCTGP
jgi:hypothetical protein